MTAPTRPLGLVVCVGYDDLLAITLPANLPALSGCLVVTSPEDERTRAVAAAHAGVEVLETDAFTRHGAAFNKGLAVEEAFDRLGRERAPGWVLVWDADTVFPRAIPWRHVRPGCIHGARRKVLDDPRDYAGPGSWCRARRQLDDTCIGFFQLFQPADPVLAGRRPWYDPTFAHAGGCDDHFIRHWPRASRVTLPAHCLHLGPVATNWYGRASDRVDGMPDAAAAGRRAAMDALIKRYDWHWARPGLDMDALADDPEIPHRVEIPGVGVTRYEVPFARRGKGDVNRPRR